MYPCGLVGRSLKYPKRDRPFPSRRPLFQSEAKCQAIDMKIIFYSHTNETHFPRKVLHLASYWKRMVLELGNCPTATIKIFCVWTTRSTPPLSFCQTKLQTHYWYIKLVILSFTFMCRAFTWTQWKPCFLMQFPRNLQSDVTSDTKRPLQVSYAASRS